MAQVNFTAMSTLPSELETDQLLIVVDGIGYKTTRADLRKSFGRLTPVERLASWTISEDDANVVNVITGSGTINITIPDEATDPLFAGFTTRVRHDGTATVNIVEGGAVTAVPSSGTLSVAIDDDIEIYYPGIETDRWLIK